MHPGIYSAASAMDAASANHEIIARNLAFAQQPGYRSVAMAHRAFESALEDSSAVDQNPAGGETGEPATNPVAYNFAPGPFQATGNPLDLAIDGEGFFTVKGVDGRPLYTRCGAFHLSHEGELVTAEGLSVVGEGGSIVLDPTTSPSEIQVGADGQVMARNVPVGKLKIAAFDDPQRLASAGATLFAAPDGVETEEGTVNIVQGTRELSNVSPVEELVRMIAGVRQYEAAQRAIDAISRAVELNASPR